jgi:hypothetical protein
MSRTARDAAPRSALARLPASFGIRAGVAIRALVAALVACVLATPIAAAADAAVPLKEMMGVYLGRATVRDLDVKRTEERDIDVEIVPFDRDGFRIRWVNVTLVDGRRNVPGVKRRVSELTFRPAKGRAFFVEAPQVNVFAEREETTPIGGDPVRWAVLDAAGLHVYSFVVLDDGRYELQTYSRKRTSAGISLRYERVVDGKPLREIDGQAVKVTE